MERFETRLLNHSLRETMTALREALDAIDESVVEQADQERDGAIERAELMLDYVDGLLAGAEPALVSRATLDALHGPIDQALAAVRNLPTDPATYSNELDTAVENALAQTASLATAASSFSDSAKKLGRKSGGFTRRMKKLDGDAEMIREELEQLESRRKSDLEEMATEQDEKRTELLSRLDEIKARADAEETRITSLVSTFEQTFETGQAERSTQFDELVAGLKEKSDETASALAEDAEKAKATFSETAQESLNEIEGIRGKVGELYGLITDTSTAGAFGDEAKAQEKKADNWRLTAVGFGTAGVVIAVAAVALAASIDLSPAVVIAKVTASLAAVAVAAYAAKQSAHHREREEVAKRLELELVASEGFMHSLEFDEQRDLRKGYYDRAFRGRPDLGAGAGAEVQVDSSFGLTPDILVALATLAKALQSQER